jgi:23S rRNA U2552 (ribose-2'-O)-methylase RlmE/FtsJ
MSKLSPRLSAVVEALPLAPGMRVLEIGGAPGAAARAVCERIAPGGHILVIDRSAKGVAQIESNAADEIARGLLSVRRCAAEEFTLLPGEEPFDLAFAVRVGALDGRRPEAGVAARDHIRRALVPGAHLFVDGGNPLRSVDLS